MVDSSRAGLPGLWGRSPIARVPFRSYRRQLDEGVLRAQLPGGRLGVQQTVADSRRVPAHGMRYGVTAILITTYGGSSQAFGPTKVLPAAFPMRKRSPQRRPRAQRRVRVHLRCGHQTDPCRASFSADGWRLTSHASGSSEPYGRRRSWRAAPSGTTVRSLAKLSAPARRKRPDQASSPPSATAQVNSTTRSGWVQPVNPSHFGIERVMFVATRPGAILNAWTPVPSSDAASASVSRISPALPTE